MKEVKKLLFPYIGNDVEFEWFVDHFVYVGDHFMQYFFSDDLVMGMLNDSFEYLDKMGTVRFQKML